MPTGDPTQPVRCACMWDEESESGSWDTLSIGAKNLRNVMQLFDETDQFGSWIL